MAELTDIPEVVSGEVLDAVETVASLAPRTWFFLGLGVGLVGGAALGYFYADKRLREGYAQKAEEEILQMQEHFRQKVVALREREESKRPLEEVAKEAGYVSTNTSPPEPPERETRNVFEQRVDPQLEAALASKDADEGWDYEVEIRTRSADRPYVIHEDERNEKPGYDINVLTYYEADDVLADDDDHIIEDRDEVLGEFQDKWGHGSGDPNVVFIRNEVLQAEYEVCRSTGSYAEDVHGIRHSDESFQPVRRRSRHDE